MQYILKIQILPQKSTYLILNMQKHSKKQKAIFHQTKLTLKAT